jgi:hypothetical protein
MKGAIRERALFGTFLLGLAAAACDSTALVGAEQPKTDSGQGHMMNLAGSGGATGVGAGADAGVAGATGGGAGTGAGGVGATGGGAGTDAGIYIAGDMGGTGTPMPVRWLFFDSLRGGNRDIYAIRADGTNLKRMTTWPTTEQEPSVSPDGTTLAFSSDMDGTFQIYLMPLPAGAIRPLTHHAGGAQQPSWSPDGKQLVYFSNMGLELIGSDGQNDHSVIGGNVRHGVFSPSGDALVFDHGHGIQEVSFAGAAPTGAPTSIVAAGTGEHPSVSPDGHWVAFDAWGEMPLGYRIWISPLAADTTPTIYPKGPVPVTTEGPARFPSISPEGLIAFESGDAMARIGIVIQGGGPAMDVTHGEGDDRNPTWSPASLVLPDQSTAGASGTGGGGGSDGFAGSSDGGTAGAAGQSTAGATGNGLGFGGSAITTVVPTPGCGVDPGQAIGMAVRGTIQTMGMKDWDCADFKCGPWSYLREYFVTLPVGYDNTKAYPLVFEGPGAGGHGDQLYALPDLASTVIRVGLTPSVDAQRLHATSPDQGCFDDYEGDDSVDWVFYESLYDQLAGQLCFDKNRVFASGNGHNCGGSWLANELGCKYAGDPTRPVRGVLTNNGGLLTDPMYVPTCTTKPMAGIWVFDTMIGDLPFYKVPIARAMKVNGCTIGTGYDDASFDNFPIGGGNPDTTCQKIKGCPDLYPLVVCVLPVNAVSSNASVVNPGWSMYVKLFENSPLLSR